MRRCGSGAVEGSGWSSDSGFGSVAAESGLSPFTDESDSGGWVKVGLAQGFTGSLAPRQPLGEFVGAHAVKREHLPGDSANSKHSDTRSPSNHSPKPDNTSKDPITRCGHPIFVSVDSCLAT